MPAANSPTPDSIIRTAIEAVRHGGDRLLAALEELPAPIYVTNPDGVITYYNRACVRFAGRTPRVGQDSWCVTWRLYTDGGQFLPRDECPMAVAIRERPDGTRVTFMAYPTPLLDDQGNLVGAVNLLSEVSAGEHVQTLRAQAARCRRLTASISDKQTMTVLTAMAAEYDEQALRLERSN